MLKNDIFLTSIFQGFGRRFGVVFGRFFGIKMHSKSDSKKSARQAKSIGKTNTKSMSELSRQRLFRAKIAEKSHVCWNIVFRGVLDGCGVGGWPCGIDLMALRKSHGAAFRKLQRPSAIYSGFP